MMPNARLFSSTLAPSLQAYVDLKRALGRRFDAVTHTLVCMDRFLKAGKCKKLDSAAFEACAELTKELLPVFAARGCGTSAISAFTKPAPSLIVLFRI